MFFVWAVGVAVGAATTLGGDVGVNVFVKSLSCSLDCSNPSNTSSSSCILGASILSNILLKICWASTHCKRNSDTVQNFEKQSVQIFCGRPSLQDIYNFQRKRTKHVHSPQQKWEWCFSQLPLFSIYSTQDVYVPFQASNVGHWINPTIDWDCQNHTWHKCDMFPWCC